MFWSLTLLYRKRSRHWTAGGTSSSSRYARCFARWDIACTGVRRVRCRLAYRWFATLLGLLLHVGFRCLYISVPLTPPPCSPSPPHLRTRPPHGTQKTSRLWFWVTRLIWRAGPSHRSVPCLGARARTAFHTLKPLPRTLPTSSKHSRLLQRMHSSRKLTSRCTTSSQILSRLPRILARQTLAARAN